MAKPAPDDTRLSFESAWLLRRPAAWPGFLLPGHLPGVEQLGELSFGQHIFGEAKFADRPADGVGLFRQSRGGVVANDGGEGGDHGEASLHHLLAARLVGPEPLDALLGESSAGVREEGDGAEEVGRHDGEHGVELEVPLLA